MGFFFALKSPKHILYFNFALDSSKLCKDFIIERTIVADGNIDLAILLISDLVILINEFPPQSGDIFIEKGIGLQLFPIPWGCNIYRK